MNTTLVEQNNRLAIAIDESGLAPEARAKLVAAYKPLWESAVAEADKAASIQVTDATQLTEMKAARAARLALKDIRVETDKTRKGLKENVLRWQQAIDGAAKVIREFCEPIEARLEGMEKFAERAEAARRAELRASRGEVVALLGGDPAVYPLEDMSGVQFAELRETLTIARDRRADQERREHAEREAAEKARQEEAERMRAENARLKAERDEQARKLREEQERARKAEAEAIAAKEKAEREAAERAAAERREQQAQAKARRKAEAAPDAEKIRAVAKALEAIQMPTCRTAGGQKAIGQIARDIGALAAGVAAIAEELES